MAKLSQTDMEELKDILSLGCDYADTKTFILDVADKTLQELGADLGIECMLITDGEYEGDIGLEKFVDKFYSNVIQNVLNVVATQ